MTPSPFFRLFAFLLIVGWTGFALPQEQAKVTCALDDDGRAVTFTVSGVMVFRGSFSAIFVRGEQTRELLSTLGVSAVQPAQTQVLHAAEGVLLAAPETFTENTPCGRAPEPCPTYTSTLSVERSTFSNTATVDRTALSAQTLAL